MKLGVQRQILLRTAQGTVACWPWVCPSASADLPELCDLWDQRVKWADLFVRGVMKIWLPRLTPKLSFSSLTKSQKTVSSELGIEEDRTECHLHPQHVTVLKASTPLRSLQPSCHSPERKKSKIMICCALWVFSFSPLPISSAPISLFEEILC